MEKDTLALEILHELKATIKRLLITVVILIVLLFGTNLAWSDEKEIFKKHLGTLQNITQPNII